MIKIYDYNTVEYLKDGYIDNNTILSYIEETANFEIDIVATVATAYLEKVDEEKLKIKVLSTTEIDSYSCIVTSDQVYLINQSLSDVGLYNYRIDIDGVDYWSDLFCINESVSNLDMQPMDGGILKIYNKDFFEYSKDGYIDNNTILPIDGALHSFYFESKLTVSTKSAELFKVDNSKLKIKDLTETKIKDITLLSVDGKVYLITEDYNNVSGTYRYKITVNSSEFWSALFCINYVGIGIGTMIIEDTFIIA